MHSGTANNAGAILVVGRGLVIVPKLIHPLPPPLLSPETSPERFIDDAWMQVSVLLDFCMSYIPQIHVTCSTDKQHIFWPSWEIFLQELNIQRPPTPTRGRPQPDIDRHSLAYIWLLSCDIYICSFMMPQCGYPKFLSSKWLQLPNSASSRKSIITHPIQYFCCIFIGTEFHRKRLVSSKCHLRMVE